MYNMLIVDDETQIREGLRNIIHWEEYGIRICGEASNGVEGMRFAESIMPSIVLTDIQMPQMNGLDLMAGIQRLNPGCKMIVLSGYDDFKLVRQAMRLGAIDYLLKPAGRDEIIQIIEEVISSLEDEQELKSNQIESFKLLKNNVLKRMVYNQITPMELRNKIELLELEIPKGGCCIALVDIIGEGGKNIAGSAEPRQTVMEAILFCEKEIEETGRGYVFFDSTDRICIFLGNVDEAFVSGSRKNVFNKVLDYIENDLGETAVIAVGGLSKTYRSIGQSYAQALKTFEYQFVFGSGNILYSDEIEKYFLEKDDGIDLDGNLLRELMMAGDYVDLSAYIRGIFEKYSSKVAIADRFVLRNCAMELMVLAYQCFESVSCTEKQQVLKRKADVLNRIAKAHTLEEMQKVILYDIEKILRRISEIQHRTYSRVVFDTIQRIHASYMEDNLSLQYLADEYHINVAYFGRLFKKETGVSFNDYLNNFRIEKAKELLETTNFKGSELCRKVGFTSYNYFYIVFKKITGIKPTDYRK